jgi:5'-nucleotidase
MHRHCFRRPFTAVAIALLAAACSTSAIAQGRPLRILLTNDDGFDSNGLKVMRAALISAGHTVTVVAPATNQSATSMSMTSGVIKVERPSDGVWAVHGTPADAVMIGLMRVLRDTPPDLVISGTNAGQNLGSSTNSSGTVSAAIAAARYGVPAMATSGGIGAESGTAYTVAAALATQIITALDAGRSPGARLLAEGLAINLNVPALPMAGLQGIRWAPLSRRSSYARVYSDTENANEVRSRLTAAPSIASEKDTDLALFNQGYVTLTLLDGDLSVSATASDSVAGRLTTLSLPKAVPQ